MEMVKNLLGDSAKYGIGSVITKFFSILIVPIIAKNYPPDIFGEINVVTTFIALFTGITILGLDAAGGYYYYYGEEELKKDYLGTAFVFRILISVCVFAIFILFSRKLASSNFLLKNQDRYFLIILGASLIPFDNSFSFFTGLTRLLIKPGLYNIINISKILLYFSFIVIFLAKGLLVEHIFISMIISSSIPVLVLFIYYQAQFNFKLNKYCLIRLLKYGLPLMPTTIMFWIINSVSRFILNNYTGLEEVGIYSMMISISSIFLLITGSIMTAYPAFAMSVAKRDDVKQIYAKIFHCLLLFLVPLAFLFWSISDIAILLFSRPIYLRGSKAIIFIVLEHIVNLLYQCGAIGLTLTKNTIYITYGYCISGVITIVLARVLVSTMGIIGAAISVFLGYLIAIFFIIFKSQKFYQIPYRSIMIIFYSIITLIILSILVYLPELSIVFNFLIRFSIGCLYLCVPFILGIISFSEIKNAFPRKKIA